MGKRRSKPMANIDALALAELQAASIDRRTQRGLPPTKQKESWWSPEVAAALQKRHAIRGNAGRGRLLSRALTDDRLSVQALALKMVETIDDRLLGKPTERKMIASHIRVEFGRLDPSLLPDPKKKSGNGGDPRGLPPATGDPEDE